MPRCILGSDPNGCCRLRVELEAQAQRRSHPDGAVRSFDLLWTFLRKASWIGLRLMVGAAQRPCAGGPGRVAWVGRVSRPGLHAKGSPTKAGASGGGLVFFGSFRSVAEGLVDLAGDPEPVHQDGQLSRDRDLGAFFRVLAAAFG